VGPLGARRFADIVAREIVRKVPQLAGDLVTADGAGGAQ
jgi:hypothetical protein